MSLMSYTYASAALGEEITLIITMPEKSSDEVLPFAAAILIPPSSRESSYYLRMEPLERYGRGQLPFATASLPGRVAKHPISALKSFLVHELPLLLGQFPLKIIGLYVHGGFPSSLLKLEDALMDCFPGLKLNTADETLAGFLGGMAEAFQSSTVHALV